MGFIGIGIKTMREIFYNRSLGYGPYRSGRLSIWLQIITWVLVPVEFITCAPCVVLAFVGKTSSDYEFTELYLREPLKKINGINLYTYADSNPVNKVDPLGLTPDPKRCPEIEYEWKLISRTLLETEAEEFYKDYLGFPFGLDYAKNAVRWKVMDASYTINQKGTLLSAVRNRLEYFYNKCGPPPGTPPSSPEPKPASEPAPVRVYPKPDGNKYQINPVANVSVWTTVLGLAGIGALIVLAL